MEQSNELDGQSYEQSFVLSAQATQYIEIGSKWAKFIAILGFVASGFIAIMMLVFLFVSGTSTNALFGSEAVATGAFMFIIYGSIFVIYFFESLYLYKFADRLLTAVGTQSNASFEEALVNYKRLFKMVGILSIVTIGLYIIVLIGFLLTPGLGSFPIN